MLSFAVSRHIAWGSECSCR